ncbi:unnamed protein product [Ixodes hexagonus]
MTSDNPEHLLSKASPFLIEKGIKAITTVTNIKKLASGDLLLEVASETASKTLLSAKALADIPVTLTPHHTLKSSRGVISVEDLLDILENEILEGLSEESVTAVQRIKDRKKRQGNSHKASNTDIPNIWTTFAHQGWLPEV